MTGDGELSGARKAFIAIALPVALLVAVVAQLTVVNRVPLPGGNAPDLVLLLVTAVAVRLGPLAGTLAGFAGGLALDVAPPAAHYTGEYALIFCLVGYAAGRAVIAFAAATGTRPLVMELTVMAAALAAGEAGKAAIGLLLSDPDVTGPAIRQVLPGAVGYDLLLSPFVLWLVWVATRPPAAERAPAPEFTRAQRLHSAFRLASTGAAPSLGLAGTGAKFTTANPRRREPRLRLAGARTPALDAANRAGLPGGRAARLNFAKNASGWTAPAGRQPGTPGKNWLRAASGPAPALRRPATPGKNWVRSAGSGLTATAPRRAAPGKNWLRSARPAAAPRRSRTPAPGWMRGSGSGVSGLTARPGRPGATVAVAGRRSPKSGWLRTPKWNPANPDRKSPGRGWLRSSGPALSALTARPGGPGAGAGVAVAGRRRPKSGWLRTSKWDPANPSRKSPGRGWLRDAEPRYGARPAGLKPGHGWLRDIRRPGFRANWYASAPSGRWLRRGRRPWRSASVIGRSVTGQRPKPSALRAGGRQRRKPGTLRVGGRQ